MGSLGRELQQAVVSWCSILAARSCTHDVCVFWRWPKTWKLDRLNRVLKQKLRATHRKRTHVPSTAGDGACRDTGTETVSVERIGSDGTPEAFSLFRARRYSRNGAKVYKYVPLLYSCTSIDIVDGHRGKNEKYVIMTTRPKP